jgi:hypothetical protein
MDPGIIFAAITALVVGTILFLVFFFNRKAVVRRHLKRAVLKPIGSVTNGEVAKITGNVELTGAPLTAPLSGRKCAYYYVLVEQHVSSGKSSHWQKFIEEEVSGQFGIRDGNSCARIISKRIKTYIVEDRKYESGVFEEPSAVMEDYLRKHGKTSEGAFGFNRTLKFREGVLEAGERVQVLGKCNWQRALADEWSDNYGKILIISDTDKMPVYLSDEPVVSG